ncbi:MAG: multicopper oxidase domain-containing protein [Actinomycetaceae bacterium]|nr:multicopper oxidase domain-containing protein [Actinomycetaceae bacterium]
MSNVQPAKITPSSSLDRAGAMVMGVVTVVALTITAVILGPGRPVSSSSHEAGAAGGTATSHAAVTPTGQTTTVEVSIKGMAFTPSSIEVPAGNRLVITVKNTGDQRHDLALSTGQTTGSLAPGESGTIDVEMVGGNISGWCTLPGHREAGMTFDVIATGVPADGGVAAAPGTTTDQGAAGSHSMSGMGGHGDGRAPGVPTAQELTDYAATVEPYPAALKPLGNERVHRLTMEAREGEYRLTNNVTRKSWSFNGQVPGPMLHGRVGDTFHITLKNDGSMGHSLDFHAGIVSPDEVMKTIEPGQTLEYTFKAERAGIWLYHCATHPMAMHIAQGMNGAVIIEPEDADPVDHQFALVAQEFYLSENGGYADPKKLAAMTPDLQAFNGRPYQYMAHPLRVKVGERVRIWVMDAGPNIDMAFHVVGTQFDTVWNEGDFTLRKGGPSGKGGAQVLPLLAAQGGFVEFTLVEPGTYTFVNHRMSMAEAGAMGQIIAEK